MIDPTPSRWLVPFDERFDAGDSPCSPKGEPDKEALEEKLAETLDDLFREQRKLMAQDRHALLVILQGLDACGKDGTIRAISRGLDVTGCRVTSFKTPSAEELDHDFLWRINRALPERGTIGIFNRSHYEEVLVVKVQPEFLKGQRLPDSKPTKELWQGRYESMRELEQHLARNGTTVRKFWLNVSKDEQRKRFLERIDEPDSHWKFSADDIAKRERRKEYMAAYSDALTATSRPWAPWYAIPADNKAYMRLTIAEILLQSLKAMKLEWPAPSGEALEQMQGIRKKLLADD